MQKAVKLSSNGPHAKPTGYNAIELKMLNEIKKKRRNAKHEKNCRKNYENEMQKEKELKRSSDRDSSEKKKSVFQASSTSVWRFGTTKNASFSLSLRI